MPRKVVPLHLKNKNKKNSKRLQVLVKGSNWEWLLMDRRRQWHPTPVLLPGKSHGRRILVGCSLWGHTESDTTERLHFHFSLSCIGEGNGNPLQRSCLENPRDGGAWWAAVYGVTQSRTQLKRLSSSSSSNWGLDKLYGLHKFILIAKQFPIGNSSITVWICPNRWVSFLL